MDPSVNNNNQPASEPCPTPLAWQEVVQSFHESAVSRVFASDGAETLVTEFGVGRPLIFFPGLAGNHLLFTLTAWLLKDDYSCILIDQPQWKKLPKSQQLVEQSAETLGLVTEHFCPDGADLFAPSFGGQIALQLMLRSPQLVRRAILQGAWPTRQLNWAERTTLQTGRLLPGPVRRAPLWLRTQLQNHRRWFPPFDESRFGFLIGETGHTPLRDVANRLLASAQTNLVPQLSNIRQPVLILRSEGDGALIDAAENTLETNLPHATSEWMHTTGHFPYLTHPHRLVKILKTFLTDSGTTAAPAAIAGAQSH